MFLSVGRNHIKKGYKYLLEATKYLKDKVESDFIVVIVGSGLSVLKNIAEKLNISENVMFIDTIYS